MSTLASVHIESWGNEFVVIGQFENMIEISPPRFKTYREALSEMAKTVAREQLRYESGLRGSFDR